MALLRLGALVTGMSGKIGGQSIANYRGFTTIKNIVQPSRIPTAKQSIQRNILGFISNLWQFITTVQRGGWENASSDYTYVNSVGDVITRNGYQTFSFCNQNLKVIDIPRINDAPIFIPVAEPKINVINISTGNFEIGSNNASSDYLYAIFGVANLSFGQSAQTGLLRFLTHITAAQLNAGYDVVSDLKNVFGSFSFPNKLAVTIDPINLSTGNRKQFVEIIENINVPMSIEIDVTDGETITIPFAFGGTFLGSVNFADGNTLPFVSWNDANLTHTYTLGGTYVILIFGVFAKFVVNNGDFKSVLTNVFQFGNNPFTTLNFHGCLKIIDLSPVDTPTLSGGLSIVGLFRDCSNLNSVLNIEFWDITGQTSLSVAFRNTNLNQSLDNWNMESITNMGSTFGSTPYNQPSPNWRLISLTSLSQCFLNSSFNQDVSTWQIGNTLLDLTQTFSGSDFRQSISAIDTSNVTSMTQTFRSIPYNADLSLNNFGSVTNMVLFFQGNNAFTTAFYDALLIKIVADGPQNNVTAGFTNANFTIGGAGETARNNLIATFGWIITDGGGV